MAKRWVGRGQIFTTCDIGIASVGQQTIRINRTLGPSFTLTSCGFGDLMLFFFFFNFALVHQQVISGENQASHRTVHESVERHVEHSAEGRLSQ